MSADPRKALAPLTDARVVATFGSQRPVRGVNPYEEIDLDRAHPARPLADGGRPYFSNACRVSGHSTFLHI